MLQRKNDVRFDRTYHQYGNQLNQTQCSGFVTRQLVQIITMANQWIGVVEFHERPYINE